MYRFILDNQVHGIVNICFYYYLIAFLSFLFYFAIKYILLILFLGSKMALPANYKQVAMQMPSPQSSNRKNLVLTKLSFYKNVNL